MVDGAAIAWPIVIAIVEDVMHTSTFFSILVLVPCMEFGRKSPCVGLIAKI